MREVVFAAALLVAGVLVTVGAALVAPAAGFAVGGVLLAVWSWLLLGESEPVAPAGDDES